jgi:hypothetical protein
LRPPSGDVIRIAIAQFADGLLQGGLAGATAVIQPSGPIGAEILAHGTLHPDVIESVSFTGGPSVTCSKMCHRCCVVTYPFAELQRKEARISSIVLSARRVD